MKQLIRRFRKKALSITSKLYGEWRENKEVFVIRHRYAICCVLSTLASLLGVATPLLSALIVSNIINNLNVKGIIPTIIAMILVKGTKMLLRGKVNKLMGGAQAQAPLAWLQRRISKRLWWLEPMVSSLGWVGMVITKLTGSIKVKASAFAASFLTDLIAIIASGVMFYFTRSYALSLLITFTLPLLSVMPWLAKKTVKFKKFSRQR